MPSDIFLGYIAMKGFRFSKHIPGQQKSPFEKLLDIFLQLLPYTSGDVPETLSWMNELDKEYKLTNDNYGMGDFIQDLKDKGYLKDDETLNGQFKLTGKTEQLIRKKSLEVIFGKLRKSNRGSHRTNHRGSGHQ